MSNVERQAARANLWTALGERALKVGQWLDWTFKPRDVVAAVIVAATYGVAVFRHVPGWLWPPLCLFTLGTSLQIIAAVMRIRRLSGIKKLDLKVLAADCISYRQDVFEFLVSRADTAPGRADEPHSAHDPQAMHTAWARGIDYRQKTSVRLAQKFAHRIVAINQQLAAADVTQIDLWGFDHNAAGIAAHVGAVGELLDRGLLDEARTFNPDQMRRTHFHLS